MAVSLRAAVLGLALLTVPAAAEQYYNAPLEFPVPQATATPGARPSSIGKPHTCQDQYPPEAVAQRASGTTTVQFTITATGDVADISVVKSSGNKLLDDAAVSCAAQWHYKPALDQSGRPVAVSWKANVVWELRQRQTPLDAEASRIVTLLITDTTTCLAKTTRLKQMPDDFDKTTLLKIVRKKGKQGKIVITVAETSGDEELDDDAIICIRKSPHLAELIRLGPNGDDEQQDKTITFPIPWKFLKKVELQRRTAPN